MTPGGFGQPYRRWGTIGKAIATAALFASIFYPWAMSAALLAFIVGGVCDWLWWRNVKTMLRVHGVEYCLTCGYSRKTLSDDRPCPECGSSYNRADNAYVLEFYGLDEED